MATVPTPHTYAVGEIDTAANENSQSSGITFLLGGAAGRKPTFRAYRAAAQSIPNSAETAVLWDTVSEDTDSGYNPASGIYTIGTAGFWLIQTNLTYATNSTGVRAIHIVNSANVDSWTWLSAVTDGSGRVSTSLLVRLAAGNTVNVNAYQTSGAALNTATTNNFACIWLGQ